MTAWTTRPTLCPRGDVEVPGDKSIAHRALLLGAIADGTSELSNVPDGQDVQSTASCLIDLGVDVRMRAGQATVIGCGLRGLHAPGRTLDCGNSGTTMRLLAGLLAGQAFDVVLDGDGSLRQRPMRRVAEPLVAMGARIETEGGSPPLRIQGAALTGIDYATPVPSAQVKSCVLLAGLLARGTTVVRETHPSRDHTERLLRACGAKLEGEASGPAGVRLEPPGRIEALRGRIPGDVSSALYWVLAAVVAPGSRVHLHGVGWNPTRRAAFELLREWGADISAEATDDWHGEPVADVVVVGHDRPLRGGIVRAPLSTAVIDEIPALALLAPLTTDGLEVRDAAELRVKESDRIASSVAALHALGARAEELPDGLRVPGGQALRGGRVDAAGDHRLALATAALGGGVDAPVEIAGGDAARVSYPRFMDELLRLGADG